MKVKKKSLLANITSISNKIKDGRFKIEVDKIKKNATLCLSSATLMWEEIEKITVYCVLNEVNWEINAIDSHLEIYIWEEN